MTVAHAYFILQTFRALHYIAFIIYVCLETPIRAAATADVILLQENLQISARKRKVDWQIPGDVKVSKAQSAWAFRIFFKTGVVLRQQQFALWAPWALFFLFFGWNFFTLSGLEQLSIFQTSTALSSVTKRLLQTDKQLVFTLTFLLLLVVSPVGLFSSVSVGKEENKDMDICV